MEDTNWEQKLHALTHVMTSPTTSPPLHSQVFISTQIPCYLDWDYPPLLCRRPSAGLRWGVSQFVKRFSRFGLPETSWRSKCPYQVPPPAVMAKGVEEGRWSEEERRRYVRERMRRKRLGSDVHPLVPIVIPNMMLLALLVWDPVPIDDTP
ncbi:uncharacterized protein LOC127249989 [Andrographis paniculata]|uniref:uncharacterized protein LOC127249989 n=1 Tax=Andrographis paniculata TaxID=175694 RepID=UPI0021E84800|nr:uncharacterized protein LOC127249989 [Andrographis paniculata]